MIYVTNDSTINEYIHLLLYVHVHDMLVNVYSGHLLL